MLLDRQDLGLDNSYYKICIFENNFNDITIIDKVIQFTQNFWAISLDLKLFRDSDTNTDTLIRFVKNNSLFSEKVINQINYEEIKELSLEYIFENISFDKVALTNKLVQIIY